MTTQLAGRVALVTGGGSGIGQASAFALAREGARVIIGDIAVEAGENTAQQIRDMGGEAFFVKMNVANEKDIETAIEKAVALYGSLDCAVNNAGIRGTMGAMAACTEDNWDRVIQVNLKSTWLCLKHEIRQMRKQESGSIVNMSSIAGVVAAFRLPAYTASKHGVVGLTKSAALEYAKAGIRVNAICPGFIETPMVNNYADSAADLNNRLDDIVPMGRLGKPEEIAEAVVWLCSDRSSYVTGHALVVDGGLVVQ